MTQLVTSPDLVSFASLLQFSHLLSTQIHQPSKSGGLGALRALAFGKTSMMLLKKELLQG